jgi:D-sedoheptulose 7-phosphate isomerase
MIKELNDHLELFKKLDTLESELIIAAQMCSIAIKSGGKVFFIGNGGSAADAQHLAAEMVGRFVCERRALPGLALTTDSSCLTCIGNDYGFDYVFSRQIEGLGRAGDVLIAISTSGNSKNLLRAVESCRMLNIATIGLLGCNGGHLAPLVDLPIVVPHTATARIQEAHIFLGHQLCQMIEVFLGFHDESL